MPEPSTYRTSVSLLGRLQQAPANQAAWNEFVSRYGPRIYDWCCHWGCQEADAQDVTQDVLLLLARKMRGFQYDPTRGSFRGWLKTLSRHAWEDFTRNRHRPGAGSGGSQILEVLQSVQAREDLTERLEAEFDRELLDTAMTRVRQRVQPHTWEAFHLLAVEGLSGAEAAERLGMKVATIFVARSKVQKMIQEELHLLDTTEPEEAT